MKSYYLRPDMGMHRVAGKLKLIFFDKKLCFNFLEAKEFSNFVAVYTIAMKSASEGLS